MMNRRVVIRPGAGSWTLDPRDRAWCRTRFLVALLSTMCWVGSVGAAGAQDADGGTQSPFSSIGAGSRAIALGQAYVSIADDASAIFWNPATLRNVQSKQLMAMYMPLYGDFTDATYTFLGAVYPTLNAGALGIAFMRIGTDFEGFDANSLPTGTLDYSETQLLIGYAFERRYRFLMGSLASGVSFKIANQEVAALSSTSPGIDVGFRWAPDFSKKLSIGLNFRDLVGPEHRLVSEADETDKTIVAGVGYRHVFTNGAALQLAVQLDSPERADSRIHFGGEYAFSKYTSLRLGVDDGDFTFGLGLTVRGFGFDYAFLNRDTAGSSHPVTFTTNYGKTLFEQREVVARQREADERRVVQEAYAGRVQEHRDLANQGETNGDFSGALDEWKIVLEYVPGDLEATEHMQAISDVLIEQQARETQDIEKRATISAHFSQGLRLYQESDYLRSRSEWRAVLAIDSTHAGAMDYLQKTQQKIDEQVSDHIARAQRLEGRGRFVEAIGEWNNVEAFDPGNSQARAAIGRIEGKIQSQSRNLREAARRLDVVNLYDTALQDYNQGNYANSIVGLDRLLELEPGHKEAKKLLRLARRKLTPLTNEEEDQVRRLYLRGMQFFSKDQYAKAIVEWEKILDIDPTNESVQRNIDEANERLRQLDSGR